MANTYKLISSTTVGSGGAANITFTSIPNTYTDLVLKLSGRTNPVATDWVNCSVTINGSTSNFSQVFLFGDGSATSAASRTDNLNIGFANASTSTSNTFSNEEFYFTRYASSNLKRFGVDKIGETNAAAAYQHTNSVLWSNSAEITSITITPQSGSYVENTTAYLYGISNS
jgi:hypothetical protein